MSRHVWNVQRMSRDTVLRGLYAYCLARHGGWDCPQSDPTGNQSMYLRLEYLPALCFAGYVMETLRQQGGGRAISNRVENRCQVWIQQIWNGATWSHHRYARGKNRDNYELAGRKMLAAAVRLVYVETHSGPEPQLGSLLLKLEETGDVLPVLRDYLEENGYEECLLILEGSFRGYTYATTNAREDEPKEAQPDSDNPPAGFTNLFSHCVQR